MHRVHRAAPVVRAAIPGVAGGHAGDGSRSDCRGRTAGRVEAPLVGIRGGGVAAQFRAGDDWCARGEGPNRRLRLDGGRRGISAWSGCAPGTWRRGHPQLRRRGPQTGAVRPGSRDPEGGPLNQRFLQEASGTEVKSSDRGTSSLETINMALEVTVGPPVRTINNGHTFLVSELDGSITPASDQGLYSADTRYLSGYQLFINGKSWTLLNSGAMAYYASQTHLVNPMVVTEEGVIAPGTLGLLLSRTLGEALHEDLDIRNYSGKHLHFILEVLMRSDFADLFEVKAKQLTRRGRIESDWRSDRQELATRYDHENFRRCLVVRLECSG